MKQTMSAFQLKHIDILHFFVTTQSTKRGHGAVGSAFEWHSKGQGFESPWLHQKISCILYDIFLFEDRGFHDFIVMLLCNTNPCGLPASKERRKRNAFAEIVRSGHSKQDTQCPACYARWCDSTVCLA